MAGGRHLLRTDKEVQKFAYFRENLANYYKFNLKSTSIGIVALVIIPVSLMYVAYNTHTIDVISKRRTKPVQEDWPPR
ncbi:hypothetical protein KL948_001860 [Ogataea haglerorum]|nr:hypothetical protein KL948_001860 [Ogataea haglerorum]